MLSFFSRWPSHLLRPPKFIASTTNVILSFLISFPFSFIQQKIAAHFTHPVPVSSLDCSLSLSNNLLYIKWCIVCSCLVSLLMLHGNPDFYTYIHSHWLRESHFSEYLHTFPLSLTLHELTAIARGYEPSCNLQFQPTYNIHHFHRNYLLSTPRTLQHSHNQNQQPRTTTTKLSRTSQRPHRSALNRTLWQTIL
jgi:hypothetical protein